jgi:hypothetical protein
MIGGLIRPQAWNPFEIHASHFETEKVLGVSRLWSAQGEPVGLQILAAVKIEI